MNNFRYEELKAKERNNDLTSLEKEELGLLQKLKDFYVKVEEHNAGIAREELKAAQPEKKEGFFAKIKNTFKGK